jgi:hypothetical protein
MGYPVGAAAAPEPPPGIAGAAARPAAGGDATANAADAARRWNLPVRGGLPWIDVQYEGSLRLGLPWPDQEGSRPAPPTAGQLWSRAIQALALSTLPDPAVIPDADIPALACVLLPPARQRALFQQVGCNPPNGRPDAPFLLKDGAAAFRARDLPAIVQAAPRLPLRLLLVAPARLGMHDLAHQRFPLQAPGLVDPSRPLALFASPADVVVPAFWRASEAEARRYAAAQAGQFGSKAWLAVTITVTGTTPGQGTAPIAQLGTGLPNRGAWLFHTDRVALYLDAGLTRELHDFTPELLRLPQPLIGTEAERSPSAPDRLPLDGEAALLLLLHHAPGLPPGLAIDWQQAAAQRFRRETELRGLERWRDADAWGTLFAAEPDAAAAEAYRRWTMQRAAVVPDRVTLTRAVSGGVEGRVQHALPVLGDSIAFLSPPSGSSRPPAGLAKHMTGEGLDPAQVLPVGFTLPGSMVPVFLVVPRPTDSYVVPEVTIPAREADDRAPTEAVMRAEVAGIEAVQADGRLNVVVRIVPEQVELRRGAAVFGAIPLPGPGFGEAQAARQQEAASAAARRAEAAGHEAEAERAAAQAEEAALRKAVEDVLGGHPEGPDIIGLRLGMDIAEAERIVRGQMTVGRVLTASAGNERDRAAELGPVRVLVNPDRTEQIGLIDGSTGRLLALTRTVAVDPALGNAQLLGSLKGKYGEPAVDSTGTGKWEWGRTDRPPCTVSRSATPNAVVVEGPAAGNAWAMNMMADVDAGVTWPWAQAGQPAPSLAALKACEPKLVVWRTNPAVMTETLYDSRIYGLMSRDRANAATAKASAPKL